MSTPADPKLNPIAGHAAKHVLACCAAILPPAVALVGWNAVYFAAILMAPVVMPVVLISCIAWAWRQSRDVAEHLAAIARSSDDVSLLRAVVFAAQLVGIFGSWQLFAFSLDLLESLGYRVRWP